ncbi:MAG: hypothetical protein LBR66_05995 [Candidatus Symbiothrix sp.]|jgi:hypothetical protein|nr:hypothetical protein [Candidatus Symbiothrix sp.]
MTTNSTQFPTNSAKTFSLMLLLSFAVSISAYGITYPAHTLSKSVTVYSEKDSRAKKLGKIKKNENFSIFAFEENWAKIRFQGQWAYIETDNIYIEERGWREVTAKKIDVYRTVIRDRSYHEEKIATLKRGTIIYVDNISGRKADIRYDVDYQKGIYAKDNGKKGYVETKNPFYITRQYVQDKNGKNVYCKSITAEYIQPFIPSNDIRAVPDSTSIDMQQQAQTQQKGALIQSAEWWLEDAVYWLIPLLTILAFLILMVSDSNIIALVPLYLIAVLIIVCDLRNSNSIGDPFAEMFLSGKFFKEVGKLALAAGVLIADLYLVMDVFRNIRFSRYGNFFIALLAVAFPAAIIAITLINVVSILLCVVILGFFLWGMLSGKGSGSTSSSIDSSKPRLGGGQHCRDCSNCIGQTCKLCGEYLPSPENMTCDNWNPYAGG